MKKIFLSFLTMLLLGGSLAWGAVNLTGTVTIEATEEEKAELLKDFKLIVGLYTVSWPKDVSMLEELSPSASTYTYTNMWSGKAFFGIGSATDMAYNEELVAQDWIIVLETGEEGNPIMDMQVSGDVTINLTIKRKGSGGGGDDDPDNPKATLLGKVLAGNDCLDGVTVAISGGSDYTAQTTTRTDAAKYDDKVGCSAGYEFANLANGTYTLTYSKIGYTTQTQEIEITEAAEKIAPAVTLEVAPVDYVFSGTLTYLNADNETVYVQGATVTAYDGAGGDATVLGTPVQTNGNADWYMSLSCLPGATVYFGAAHADIEVAERTAVQATDPTGDGIQVNIVCTPKPVDPPVEQVRLTLEANNADWGTVEGADTYDKGAPVTAKAVANEGYEFKGWQENGAIVSTDAEYNFTIETDRTLVAVFEKQTPPEPPVEKVTLTLEVNHEGWGTVEGADTYDKGTPVTAKAVANEGYEFKGWEEDGAIVSTDAEYNFKIETDLTLTAVFEERQTPPEPPVEQVRLTLEVNHEGWGTVDGADTYDKGASATATATPNEGYEFKGWQEDGAIVSTDNPYKFTIETDRTLTAIFEAIPQPPVVKDSATLTLEVNDVKMGKVEGAKKYEKGTEVTAKAVANEGYEFRAWLEGGEVVFIDAEYTFTLNADRTLTAVFVEIQQPPVVKDSVTLTLEVNDAVMGTVTGAGKYEKGTKVTALAVANKGYVFEAWKEGEIMVSTEAEYTFTLEADLTLTALFFKELANEDIEQAAWSVYTNNRTIVLCSEAACRYDIYTVSGKKIGQVRSDGKECRMTVKNGGLYVVRCTTAGGMTTKKVVVR